MSKEAKARIKINKLLEEAGWRFFDNDEGNANIVLENNAKLTQVKLDEYGEDFEKTSNGFIDYLLLDNKGFPFIVLEAKKEDINPLFAKEQARKYAQSQNCRFIILSNGNLHYFWDLQRGNPNIISKFPKPETVIGYTDFKPNAETLINETVNEDYIVKTQKPDYEKDPRYIDETQRPAFVEENKLRFLRKYQVRAIERIQEEVKEGKDRFLFEMATGTGKTLTSAAVIKLFLRTGNARRVLFLVDRLELEDQADKAFREYLKTDYKCSIYKENRDDWRQAEIVVSTVQSFLFKNKYKRIFQPTDFDLVISDEAHRSIGGNSRAVFEYFIGYKLGLTATPKDYLKKIDTDTLSEKDPRELERRMLLDTYTTFGCEDGKPTYQYSLLHGVRDGFLVNPSVVDARTEITTQLLNDEGYTVQMTAEDGEETSTTFSQRDFEKKLFSENTNRIFCKTFLENAFVDPISKEIGKTIVFCVSQNHAAKITQILNEFADQKFPGKYQSDFAMQVTSWIPDAQQHTINFTNNRLGGKGNFFDLYQTSKTRVCVTVGMMTTGYDCPDLLNVCLMRPIFSPTDFIQIKGRGTRKCNFANKEILKDKSLIENIAPELLQKSKFKLFDFFANCEFFEEKFNYDEVIKLPPKGSSTDGTGGMEFSFSSTGNPSYLSFSTKIEILGLSGEVNGEVKENGINGSVKTDIGGILKNQLTLNLNGNNFEASTDIYAGITGLKVNLGKLGTITLDTFLEGGFSAKYIDKKYSNKMRLHFMVVGVNFDLGELEVEVIDLKKIVEILKDKIKAAIEKLSENILAWLTATIEGLIVFVGDALESIGKALNETFEKTLEESAKLMKEVGYQAKQVGEALNKGYQTTEKEIAEALKKAEYLVEDIGEMLKEILGVSGELAAEILKGIGSSADEISRTLKNVYNFTTTQIGQVMKILDFSAEVVSTALNLLKAPVAEVHKVLTEIFNKPDETAREILKVAGYPINVITDNLPHIKVHLPHIKAPIHIKVPHIKGLPHIKAPW